MEERKERRYKGEDFLDFGGRNSREEVFLRKNESDAAEREDSWRRELTPGGQIYTQRERVCYPVYRYVGSGARKPISFLGPAGLLVGRMEHPSWH